MESKVIRYSVQELLALKNKPQCLIPPDFSHLDSETRAAIVKRYIEPLKHARSILNKLTPENFSSLSTSFIEIIERNKTSDLKEITNFIVKKASMDLKFSKMYAKLCDRIKNEKHEYNISNEKKRNFLNSLVGECKIFFDSMIQKSDSEDFSEIDKKDFSGLIRFISEIFKFGIVNSVVPFICAKEMMNKWNEITSEQICSLILNCGEVMEKTDSKEMNRIFTFLKNSKKKGTHSKRIDFFIDDTINLRKEKWIKKHNYQNQIEPEMRTSIETFAKKSFDNRDWKNKRGGRGGHGGHHGHQSRKQHDNNKQYKKKNHNSGSRSNHKYSNSKRQSSASESVPSPTPALPTLSENDTDRRVKSIYEEYLNIKDKTEVKECISEFEKYSNKEKIIEAFVHVCINECVWKKISEVESTRQLFDFLLENKLVSETVFKDEMNKINEIKEDLRIDIPRIEDILAIIVKDG